MIRIAHALLTSIVLSAGLAAGAASQCPAEPHLDGTLGFRGDQWTLRLHAPDPVPDSGAVPVSVDIPDLLMIGLETTVRCSGSAMTLELPFGFGSVELRPDDDGAAIRGSTLLARDSLRVRLQPGNPPPYSVEPVRFSNGDVELAGSLYLPAGSGPVPAAVVVHGSGAMGRGSIEYRSWGDFLARRGIAALVYDKRGVGESGGDFETDSAFDGLTGDVLAAHAAVAARPEIDPTRVGLVGWSQASWIAFRAAREADVAFMALVAPATVSVADQEIQAVRAGMRAADFDEAAVRRAVAHTRLLLSVAVTGIGWDALAESVARISDEPWADRVHRPGTPDDLAWWRTHAPVDPTADIDALRTPLLALFSATDPLVPARHNGGVLRELAAARTGADLTVVTVPRGSHRLEVPAGRDSVGRWNLPRIHPEAIQALTEWLAWRTSRSDGGA